jgi:5-methylcytosine-specific restriction endonuclease McrA
MSKKFKIKLNRKHKRKKLSKSLKSYIFELCNYECQLCKPKKNLLYLPNERVIDHKIPLSKGGSNDIKNLWLVCKDCDKNKKNELYPELSSAYIKNRIGYLENKIIKKRKNYGANK